MSLFPANDSYRGAIFSPDRTYRYRWWCGWGDLRRRVLFIMLNPSKADELVLDPTVKKDIRFARRWSYGALDVANAYAYRSTDPRALRGVSDPVGPENDRYILEAAAGAALHVVAWGKHASAERAGHLSRLLDRYDLYCLGTNNDGSPCHPLYQVETKEPFIWRAKSA